jgi:F-type H+-transporting ATPase subunit a
MSQPELPNLVTLLEHLFKGTAVAPILGAWENIIFSLVVVCFLVLVSYLSTRKRNLIPGRAQSLLELFVGTVDDFVCGILGPQGRRFTPFIGTLFIYIVSMNLIGLVPFMKSSTASWSTTLALALCVFVYLQYTAFKELGIKGYLDHLMGRPRGFLAFSVVMPLLMFFMHVISELVRPISLSLRLRSNIWGDDILLAVLAGFGLKGVPLLLFNMILVIIASIVQAVVFTLLTTVYFALILVGEDANTKTKRGYT